MKTKESVETLIIQALAERPQLTDEQRPFLPPDFAQQVAIKGSAGKVLGLPLRLSRLRRDAWLRVAGMSFRDPPTDWHRALLLRKQIIQFEKIHLEKWLSTIDKAEPKDAPDLIGINNWLMALVPNELRIAAGNAWQRNDDELCSLANCAIYLCMASGLGHALPKTTPALFQIITPSRFGVVDTIMRRATHEQERS